MSFKCKPGNLVMAEAVPFGQRWTYYSEHSIDEMLKPEYFASVRNQFRAGDDIRLLQVKDGKVESLAEVLVSAKDESLSFFVLRDSTEVNQPTEKFYVKRGRHCFEVVNGSSGEILQKYPTKLEAEEALQQLEVA